MAIFAAVLAAIFAAISRAISNRHEIAAKIASVTGLNISLRDSYDFLRPSSQ